MTKLVGGTHDGFTVESRGYEDGTRLVFPDFSRRVWEPPSPIRDVGFWAYGQVVYEFREDVNGGAFHYVQESP